MGKAFRTALFGGFKKKDVITYLERLTGPTGFDGALRDAGAEPGEEAARQAGRVDELSRELGEKNDELAAVSARLEETQGALDDMSARFLEAEKRAQAAEQEKLRLEDALLDRERQAGDSERLRSALQEAEKNTRAAEQRAHTLEAELAAQKRRCEELSEQRWNSMEKQWQENCRMLHETDRRAQELTLAIRCEGANGEYDRSLRRADRLLDEFRQELRRISEEVEHLAQAVQASPPRAREGSRLSSPGEILSRVSSARNEKKEE